MRVAKRSIIWQNLHNYRMIIFLCLFWVLGLLVGLHIYLNNAGGFTTSQLLHSNKNAIVSFTLLFTPLIFSLVCFVLNHTKMILCLSFLKGCAYGFSLTLVGSMFGKGSWIGVLLLLLPATVSTFSYLWLWLRHINGSKSNLYRNCVIVSLPLLAAWFADTVFLSSIQIII